MPGNSWRDKIARPTTVITSNSPAPADKDVAEGGASSADRSESADRFESAQPQMLAAPERIATPAGASALSAASVSPQLAALLKQRETLEQKMQHLVSGAPTPVDRFAVQSMRERRADYRRWETARDQHSAKGAAPTDLSTSRLATDASATSDAPTPARSGLSDFNASPKPPAPLTIAPLDRPTAKPLEPLRQRMTATDKTRLRPQLAGTDTPGQRQATLASRTSTSASALRNRDQQLNNDRVDRALKARFSDKPLTLKLTKNTDGKLSLEGRDRLASKVKALTGELAASGRYRDDAHKKLDIHRGGSGDLNEALERLRETSKLQRKAIRQQELLDDARRARALARKKNSKD